MVDIIELLVCVLSVVRSGIDRSVGISLQRELIHHCYRLLPSAKYTGTPPAFPPPIHSDSIPLFRYIALTPIPFSPLSTIA